MKKKQFIAAASVMAAIALASPAVFAAEENAQATEEAAEVVAIGDEAETETVEETTEATDDTSEEETEAETEEVEAAALLNQHLADISYEKGVLTEDGWESPYLNMRYVPGDGVLMGVNENETLQEYHDRNGEENAVAINELVAYTEDEESYVQMMVEVNPNKETDEDILERFTANEALEDTTDVRSMEIAGKEFASTTGELDGDRYFLAVSTDQDGVAIAIKMKYAKRHEKKNPDEWI